MGGWRLPLRQILLGLLLVLGSASALHAAGPVADDSSLSVDNVVNNVAGPTAMAFVGADDFLVLEKDTGKVRRVTGGALKPNAVLDLPVEHCEERGLLGIALHPDFAKNHVLYLFYNPSLSAGDEETCGTAYVFPPAHYQ